MILQAEALEEPRHLDSRGLCITMLNDYGRTQQSGSHCHQGSQEVMWPDAPWPFRDGSISDVALTNQ
jgi:hypothetical protein